MPPVPSAVPPDVLIALDAYLDAEYQLWQDAHTLRDDAEVFRRMAAFDATFFAPGLASAISRPGQMDDAAFADFRERRTHRRRQVNSVTRRPGPDAADTFQATLSAEDARFGDQPAERLHFTVDRGSVQVQAVFLPDHAGGWTLVQGDPTSTG